MYPGGGRDAVLAWDDKEAEPLLVWSEVCKEIPVGTLFEDTRFSSSSAPTTDREIRAEAVISLFRNSLRFSGPFPLG